MSSATISNSSFDMLPIPFDAALDRPRTARPVKATSKGGSGSPQQRPYQAVALAETFFYLSLLMGFVVMVFGFARMIQ
jgi:hypothetical protein